MDKPGSGSSGVKSESSSSSRGGDSGGASGAMSSSAAMAESVKSRRNRIRYNCQTCREKKLKCNRGNPCDQCLKRNIGPRCTYVPYVHGRDPTRAALPRSGRLGGLGTEMAPLERLRYLETVVDKLRRELAQHGVAGDGRPGSGGGDSVSVAASDLRSDVGSEAKPTPAGSLIGTRYVDSANWEGIIKDITKTTTDLQLAAEDDDFDEDVFIDDETDGPIIFTGSYMPVTVTEMVREHMPPRQTTDRLVARFFAGKEPAWLMFHVPTFMKEYEEFWSDPESFSLSWVGLLFIMISHAAFFCKGANEPVPGDMGTNDDVMDIYRRLSAQCLALDDFTTPGKYKVEAMILYFGVEYLRRPDAQRSTSILMSIIVRLAMHSGLHREPGHYKGISVFECEMRRRLWTVLTEIDVLVSFQFGLPGNVQREYFDTGLPHNLLDEDFDESTTELPPERPFTERTPALYTIVKSRLVVAFLDILQKMTSRHSPSYGEVRRLNGRLDDAHRSIPPVLLARSFASSVADPVELLMQRLWIELMYQKARIVLHRRFFSIAHTDPTYALSYDVCLSASMTLLQYQFDIYNEMQPGGRLAKEQWFMSSLSTHDFLLADMILCLELSHVLKNHGGQQRSPEAGSSRELHEQSRGQQQQQGRKQRPYQNQPAVDREKLQAIIGTSRNIWKAGCEKNPEAMRAFKILSRMLSLAAGTAYDESPATPVQIEEAAADLSTQKPSYEFQLGSGSQQQQSFDTITGFSQPLPPVPPQKQRQARGPVQSRQQQRAQTHQDQAQAQSQAQAQAQAQAHMAHQHQLKQHQHQAMVDAAHVGMGPWGHGMGDPVTDPDALVPGMATSMAPGAGGGTVPMNMTWTTALDTMAYLPDQNVDIGHGFDWATWDTQILNAAPPESMETQWTQFFNNSQTL